MIGFLQVPEMAPEPLAAKIRKLLPSEIIATELPTTFASAIFEPRSSPFVKASVPLVSCEHVSALAYAVVFRKTKIDPGQLAANGIT